MLYKYRSLENIEFLLDIIVNSRLFAATYEALNDPMEGYFRYRKSDIGSDLLSEIRAMKKETKILSLAKNPEDLLMWSYYANGHSGCAIGVQVLPNIENKVEPVTYQENVVRVTGDISSDEAVKKLLTTKFTAWSHEEEVRVLTKKTFVKVRIEEILFGKKSDKKTRNVITKVAKKFGVNEFRTLSRDDLK